MLTKLKSLWNAIRTLSGDNAYERYLAHHADHMAEHASKHGAPDNSPGPALSREEFFRQWQDSKWKGVKRCC